MNNKAIIFSIFVIGVAIGSVVTLELVKKKYERLAQEEIDSVKETFSKRAVVEKNENGDTGIKETQMKDKPHLTEYVTKLNEHRYVNYSDMGEENKKEKAEAMDKPYVIPPEEFGELDDYDKIGLSYYADQVLADENDDLIEDVDGIVGLESLSHFGEYEDDSVFVRNDRLKCDYEILLDQRKYSDVVKRKPHQMEE